MRILLAVIIATLAGAAGAQSYPTRSVHLIVPFPASGATDILARVVAERLAESLGQPVPVENKPGAGGSLGSAVAAKAAPDGYTILMATTSTHSIGPALQKLPYDPEKDFAPVSLIANAPGVLVVSPGLNISSVKELIALARAKPGQLNFSSSGTGTIVHLSGELFTRMAGVQMQHVPYKGTALAAVDIKSGQIAMMVDNIVSAMPFMKSGMQKALAVTSAKRSGVLPDLPTVAESGVPGYESVAYFAIFAPTGSAPSSIRRAFTCGVLTIFTSSPFRRRTMPAGVPVGAKIAK